MPGTGTFENYVEDGLSCGASADGRRNGDPIGSDLSSMPGYADQHPPLSRLTLKKRLLGISGAGP